MPVAVRLDQAEHPDGRAFADPGHTPRDLAILQRMRARLRELAPGPRSRGWNRRLRADDELHWIVVPRWQELLETAPLTVVAFFGQARRGVDHTPVVKLEHRLAHRLGETPGVLAYHNVLLADR